MKASVIIFASIAAFWLTQPVAVAGPEEDRLAFVAFFQARFPDIPVAEHANGIYAIDSDAREQWLEIEDFPPYEFTIDQGAELWQEAFADGGTYSGCFSKDDKSVEKIRPGYPAFDDASNKVITLEGAINRCRTDHDEPAYAAKDADLIAITAYLAFESRGQKLDIQVPEGNAGALAAYESGKEFYYSKRGQLNFACSDCHGLSSGQYIRADRLSAGLGHSTHFPVYRSKLGEVISIQQRFNGCVRDVRARQLSLQSDEFNNLEYFLAYMSNGLAINGPGSRK